MNQYKLKTENDTKKKSLGIIIYNTLKSYYPDVNINLTHEDVDSILSRANITKKNSNKMEIYKIVKVLKSHIEDGLNRPPSTYIPVFKEMDLDNKNLEKMKMDYFDNMSKIREKDIEVANNKNMDILPQEMRIKEMMEEDQVEFNYYIYIDSKDRDLTVYPNPSEYQLLLGVPNIKEGEKKGYINRNFEDVVSVQFIEALLIDKSGESGTGASDIGFLPYIILEIEEFGSNFEGTNESLNKAFAILNYYDEVGSDGNKIRKYTMGDYDGGITKLFKPRRNINRLSVKIKTPDGELYNFGTLTDDANGTKSFNSLAFKITTLKKTFTTNFVQNS